MVLIEAIIKPFKLDDVQEALEELGVGGMTVTEVMQSTPQRSQSRFSATGRASDLVPKIRVQVAVATELAERVVEAICLHGSAGKTEDGLLTVERIGSSVRIRTGELDGDALS